jgi:hypothetical protein
MIMKSLMILITVLVLLFPLVVTASDPASFEEVKRLSSEEGKPLLLEFFRED